MLNLDRYKQEISDIMKGLNVNDYKIDMVPGQIVHYDKYVDVIQVLIEHPTTKKKADYMYRHGYHTLKDFLQDCVNDFEKKIVTEVLNNKQQPNSL